MKKITFILMGITLISSLLITSTAVAWNCGAGRGMGGNGWGCGMGPGLCWLYGIPNLTAEQSAKLADLQKKHIEETSKLRSELAVKRIEFNQLLAQPQPNSEEVMAKQKEVTNLQSQLQQKCLRNQLEMRKILTEEQLSQLPYGYGPDDNFLPGQMRGYGPPQGQGFGPGRGGAWGHRGGFRKRCW